MSFRAVALVLLLMLVSGLSAYVALNNHVTLQMPVAFPRGYELQVYQVIGLSFVCGLLCWAFLALVQSGKLLYGWLRESRETRARERIERRYAQGLEALLGGSTARADERFRDVLAAEPQHVETLMTYGEMLRGLGRAGEAADLHRRAAALRPGDMRPLFALAADWSADGNLDEARHALKMIINANPRESLRARRELRELLMAARRWEDALREHEPIEVAVKDGPDRARERRVGLGIRYEVARETQARGQLRDAEKEYRAILRLDPTFIPASLALGETLVAAGSAEEGARAWRRGYEATQSPLFFARLEEHHLSREEPEVIIRLMRTLVDSSRSRAIPAFFLGKLYLRLEMIDEAESTFGALHGAADSPSVRHLSAMIMERRGRLKEAVAAYRRVIQERALLKPRYGCTACKASFEEPAARCPRCGDWNTIDVDLRELTPPDAHGAAPPPEWAAGA